MTRGGFRVTQVEVQREPADLHVQQARRNLNRDFASK